MSQKTKKSKSGLIEITVRLKPRCYHLTIGTITAWIALATVIVVKIIAKIWGPGP